MLLLQDERQMLKTIQYAAERQAKHARLEADRAAAGLTSDFERWQTTGVSLD